MSYNEYFDMFFETQKKQSCPYRAFTFDIVDSRHQPQYVKDNQNHHKFLEYVFYQLKIEEQLNHKKILLDDKLNLNYFKSPQITNGNLHNPIILGDMVTYFVHNGSISTERMIEIFQKCMKKFNINYHFHFNTGVYETNDYTEGGVKMYKGYMPQILENLSKNTEISISKDSFNASKESMEL